MQKRIPYIYRHSLRELHETVSKMGPKTSG